tara:strand:+ start:13373 stop:14146 length:774 start_codon:yes stop_codon:yes gene_type:complete
MARLGKERIRVSDKNDRDFFIDIEFIVCVSVEGMFTTTLDEADVKIIESYNVSLYTNGRRNARKGFFEANTKKELLLDIKLVLEKCFSRNLISEKIILKYAFATCASFCLTTEKEIIPNLGWSKDGSVDRVLGWQNGTISSHAANPHAIGVQMYVKPYHKRVYSYADGTEKTEYDVFSPFGGSAVDDTKYYLKWLKQICSTTPPNGTPTKEMEYTEERAKFFVNMFKSLCKLANSIANLGSPDELVKLIDTGKYLMP